jgi:hypothetical protein
VALSFGLLADRHRRELGVDRAGFWRATAARAVVPALGGVALAVVVAASLWLALRVAGRVPEPLTTGSSVAGFVLAGLLTRTGASSGGSRLDAVAAAWVGTVALVLGVGGLAVEWALPLGFGDGAQNLAITVAVTYLPAGLLLATAARRLPVSWSVPSRRRVPGAALAAGLVVFAALAAGASPGADDADTPDPPEPSTYLVSWEAEGPYPWDHAVDQGGQGTYTFELEAPEEPLAAVNVSVAVDRAYERRTYEEINVTIEGPEGRTAHCGGQTLGEDPHVWSCSREVEVQPPPDATRHTANGSGQAQAAAAETVELQGQGTWTVTVEVADPAGELDPQNRSYEVGVGAEYERWTPVSEAVDGSEA